MFSGGALALEPALDLRIERGAIRVELGARYLGSWQDSAIAAGSLRLDGGLGSARAGWHTPIGARFELGVAPSFAVGAVRAVGSSDSITTLATGHTLPFMMMTLDVAFEVRVVHDVAICVAVDGGAIPLGVAARTNGVIELDASGATLGLRVFARTPRF